MFRKRQSASFDDRVHAGKLLAEKLVDKYKNTSDNSVLVLACPRGGLPVAAEICDALKAPLDVVVAKKIGFPGHEEFAIGAVSPHGAIVLNDYVVRSNKVSRNYIDEQAAVLAAECQKKERDYRVGKPALPVEGKTVVLVDDGVATGMTIKAAIKDIAGMHPKQLVVAVPVIAHDTLVEFQKFPEVTEVVYVKAPEDLRAVGLHYVDFSQTEDEEAKSIFNKYNKV